MPSEKKSFQIPEIELSYKPHNYRDRPPVTIRDSKTAVDVLLENWNENKIALLEEAKLLLLNRRNVVLGVVALSSGGFAGTVIDPKLAFAIALKAAASSVIIAHNHPSNNNKPSQVDISLTHKLVVCGKFLDLPVLDHIIITPNGSWYSFMDNHMLEPSTPYDLRSVIEVKPWGYKIKEEENEQQQAADNSQSPSPTS